MPEEQILVTDPEHAFIDQTSGESVTGQNVVIDGSVEKEAVILSSWAGASSSASAASGVPSAQTQNRVHTVTDRDAQSTPAAGRHIPKTQELPAS
jgi:hypothetical protein